MPFLYFLENLRAPWLDAVFSVITLCGEETVFMAVGMIFFWCINKYTGYYLLCTGFLGTILNQFLKILCRVPRPWVKDPGFTIVESAKEAAGGYSFPSGHTQTAVKQNLACCNGYTCSPGCAFKNVFGCTYSHRRACVFGNSSAACFCYVSRL